MTTDQPVISLRPGGGGGGGPRGGRLFAPAFAVAASGSGDFLRPHGGGASGVSRVRALAARSGGRCHCSMGVRLVCGWVGGGDPAGEYRILALGPALVWMKRLLVEDAVSLIDNRGIY